MPKRTPFSDPMITQPPDNLETIPTQTQPAMPAAGQPRVTTPKKQMTQTTPLRAAKARISRRNSLRQQRQALKDKR